MVVKNLPVRYPELGRIRLGEKGGRGEPVKLETFRFTSSDEYTVKAVAAVLGGEAATWTDEKAGISEQWQVVTEAKSIEVLVPPDPLDLAYERWGSGGRQRRCDGESCMVALRTAAEDGAHFEEQPCFCAAKNLVPGDPDDVKKGGCDLVVRLKVVVPSLPGLGVWMLTSGSIYAAMELPGQLALLSRLAEHGALVPADLCIDQRTEKKAWEKWTREYPVPVLRIRQSMQQIRELTGDAITGLALASGAATSAPALGTGEHRESSRPSTIGDLAPTNQAVVYECSKLKVNDEQAHAICFALTKGRTSSRKDLTTLECAQFLGALAAGTWQQLAEAGVQPTTVHEAGPAEQQTLDATSREARRPSERETRVRELQDRARALPAYLQDGMKAWLKQQGVGKMPDASDDQLTAVDSKLTEYEAQAAADQQQSDDAAEPQEVA